MHNDDQQSAIAQVPDEVPLAPAAETAAAPLGHVFSVGGSHVLVRFSPEAMSGENAADLTVGAFLGIWTRHSLVVGVLADISSEAGAAGTQAVGRVDLLGEIVPSASGPACFERGVRSYPTIGDRVVPVGHGGLRIIFDLAGANTINVGELQQDREIGAYINVDDMVRKHFVLLGSTGAGKSSAVALVLREIMQVRPDLRIVLIDPHNEYGRSFDDKAHVVGPGNLVLPFWLLSFEELIAVVFGRRQDAEEEIGLLSELIPLAKAGYLSQRAGARTSYRQVDPQGPGYTVDTPVPYRMDDLVALIESRMGKLENRAIALQYQRLLLRMNAIRRNPRYGFLFDEVNGGEDSMVDVLCRLLRLQQDGQPLTVLQLAGFPAEVLDVVVSVLFRMAFDFGLWSDGALPVLMVCEEAHHYGHPNPEVGFGPARDAMARIAKEGRKYGVFLGLVTQRPAELDPTLISQCNTVFAMRMANERDQAIVRAAVSDAGSRLLSFLPSLGTREVLAFGEGVPIPARLRFAELPDEFIPRSEAVWCGRVDGQAKLTKSFVATVVERWRGARVSRNPQQAAEAPRLDSFFVPVESGGSHLGANYRK
jgi:DNA helicase HerA-like ATPase